jgi:hypothetical protein
MGLTAYVIGNITALIQKTSARTLQYVSFGFPFIASNQFGQLGINIFDHPFIAANRCKCLGTNILFLMNTPSWFE